MKQRVVEPRSDRRITVLAVFVALALMTPFAWPIWGGRVFSRDDLGRFHWPVRAFYSQCLQAGDDPLWHPGLYCGFYLHGEGQVGIDHPLHRLLYTVVPLSTAFSLEVFLGYPVLFVGMVLWLRRLGFPPSASLVGAISLTFSEFLILRYVHMNAIQVIAHLPWVLLAIDQLGTSRRSWLWLALLTASQGLLGYPQYLGFCLIVEASYGLVLYAKTPRILAKIGFSIGLGLLIASAQLIPHLDALAASSRAAPSVEFLGMNSLHPMNLVSIIVPFAFRQGWYHPTGIAAWPRHESVSYLGALFPASCVWLWIQRKQLGRSRALVLWSCCLGGAALIFALGCYSPLFPIYVRIPGASLFRGPARYILLSQLAASILVAVAFADLFRPRDRPSLRDLLPLFLPVLISLVASGILLWVAAARPNGMRVEQIGGLREIAASIFLITAGCGLVAFAARGSRQALLAIVLLMAFDSWSHTLSPVIRREATVDRHRTHEAPKSHGGRLVSTMNIGLDASTKLVGGYVALTPRKELDYTRPKALRLAGAEWQLEQSGDWIAFDDVPLPRVRLISKVQLSQDPKSDLEKIEPVTTALVEHPIELLAGPVGEAAILFDHPGSLIVQTIASQRRLLVISESYHNGWKAEIDGRSTSLVRAYGDFLGCVIEPGNHLVRLRFDPLSNRIGRTASCLGLGVFFLILGRSWLRSRRDAELATIRFSDVGS